MSSESRIPKKDLLLLDRFLDGALVGDELQSCRQRLERDPVLRKALQQRKAMRRGFEAGRANAHEPSPGFAANVVAAARRLPVVVDGEGDSSAAVGLCRRLLIAAAVVVAATALWHSELFHEGGDGTLQASPDEVQRTIDELDARIGRDAGGVNPR